MEYNTSMHVPFFVSVPLCNTNRGVWLHTRLSKVGESERQRDLFLFSLVIISMLAGTGMWSYDLLYNQCELDDLLIKMFVQFYFHVNPW